MMRRGDRAFGRRAEIRLRGTESQLLARSSSMYELTERMRVQKNFQHSAIRASRTVSSAVSSLDFRVSIPDDTRSLKSEESTAISRDGAVRCEVAMMCE